MDVLWDLCNDQFLFHKNHSAGRISCSPITQSKMQGPQRGRSPELKSPVANARSRPSPATCDVSMPRSEEDRWYAATIGSLSAFGSVSTLSLLPFLTPMEIEGERKPLIIDIDGM